MTAVYRQRIVTRVFLVCVGMSLTVFGFFTLLSTQTKLITVSNPSRVDFEHLWELYSNTLQCPCSEIAIAYADILAIHTSFHQLCSSRIVSPEWYDRLTLADTSESNPTSRFYENLGANYFLVLATFCSLAQNTVLNTYQQFSSKKLINNRVISEEIFAGQVYALIDTFINGTRGEFSRLLSLTSITIQINPLASKKRKGSWLYVGANKRLIMIEDFLTRVVLERPDDNFVMCSCRNQDSSCGTLIENRFPTDQSDYISIPNLVARCLITESALTSTLECWYDPSCMNSVLNASLAETISGIREISPLDTNLPSRYAINSTVQKLMDELLIENQTIHIFYDQFFSRCAPQFCTYTIEQRYDYFFVLISLSGIYSGLTKGLRLILPIIVGLVLIIRRQLTAGYTTFARDTAEAGGEYRLDALQDN